jgi:hypothetical protein
LVEEAGEGGLVGGAGVGGGEGDGVAGAAGVAEEGLDGGEVGGIVSPVPRGEAPGAPVLSIFRFISPVPRGEAPGAPVPGMRLEELAARAVAVGSGSGLSRMTAGIWGLAWARVTARDAPRPAP